MSLQPQLLDGGSLAKSWGATPVFEWALIGVAPRTRRFLRLKRAIDLTSAALGLVLGAPIILLLAILVRCTSPGPALFWQRRCGEGGRIFWMPKLRTMIVGAERQRGALSGQNEMKGPVFKIRNDPRVTSLGRFLRRYSLDELPQLWSVFRGEMSLVGPRPAVPQEVARYGRRERRRLAVRPGLTCLWQISGRNALDFDEWVRLDFEYIDNQSLRLDLTILLKTIPAVLGGTGC